MREHGCGVSCNDECQCGVAVMVALLSYSQPLHYRLHRFARDSPGVGEHGVASSSQEHFDDHFRTSSREVSCSSAVHGSLSTGGGVERVRADERLHGGHSGARSSSAAEDEEPAVVSERGDWLKTYPYVGLRERAHYQYTKSPKSPKYTHIY